MPAEGRDVPDVASQQGKAVELQVGRLEPPGGLQQRQGRIAVKTRGEGGVGSQQVDPGALELIQRPGHRGRQQVQGLAERAGLHAGLHRGQDAFGVPRRIGGQRHRTLQERRGQPRRGPAPARLADLSSSAATSSSGPGSAGWLIQVHAYIGQRG